jgi:hypothetical protein
VNLQAEVRGRHSFCSTPSGCATASLSYPWALPTATIRRPFGSVNSLLTTTTI